MNNSFYMKCVVIFCLVHFNVFSHCFILNNLNLNSISSTQNTFDPLILTPFIEKGQLKEAHKASEVINLPEIGNELTSYSGFFTVNTTYNSNLFFWFFPAQNGDPDCPVLLYLDGGPGFSSQIGLFFENGPMQVDVNGTPSLRNVTWNREFAMLYIDNPVGTGFSFTDDDAGYSRNQEDISRNLYSALHQFLLVFSEYRENAFFITGFSYGCKYIVTLANVVHERNKLHDTLFKINLRGITIGSGLCNLRFEDSYADYLFQVGLIDQNVWKTFTALQNQLNYLIDTKQYLDAYHAADRLILGYTVDVSYQRNVTGQAGLSMLRDPVDYESLPYFTRYVERPETRQSIHVGNRTLYDPTTALIPLEADMPQSTSPAIESLLNANYPVLFYNGNMDILINSTARANMQTLLLHLKWKGASKFKQASQHIYRVNNDTVAGYIRQADNLYYMVVRNSGHVEAYDQPIVVLDMITRFVRTFANCTNCKTIENEFFV